MSRLNRRQFLASAAGTFAATAMSSTPARADRPPNVIYAFSDEHRWQSMSFTEMPQVRTPNMAAMAAQGVSFTNCISNYPVCSPHRAMLMTGRWPYQQGVIDNGIDLDPNQATIGKAFRSAGYATGYVGKWHLGGVRAEPFGFDESLIWTDEGKHWNHGYYHPRDGAPVKPAGYNATVMTDQAAAFVQAHKAQPFFLMLSWHPPHSDFLDAPDDMKALYPEGSLPWRPNVPDDAKAPSESPNVMKQNSWPYYRGYHAHISAIDRELGRLLALLDQLGIADNTILVYSSDHGSMFGSHNLGSKREPYEESIRVPFLVRWPGHTPKDARPENLIGTIDVMPTLCGLAGIPVPATCAGQDFSPATLGKPGPDPDAQLIMHVSKEHASGGEKHPAPLFRGIRARNHTYAVFPDKRWLLFDNKADPYQMHNLVEAPECDALRAQLHAQLAEYLRKAEDKFVLPA